MESGDIFVEAPDHSISDGDDKDEESEDENRHNKLLQSVNVLDSRKRLPIQRSEPSTHISEFHLSQVGKEKVRVSELLTSLKESSSHIALKKQLRAVTNRNRVLPVPLAKPQAERLKREVAYGQVSKEVEKWEAVVQNNRTAEHLEFPLKQPDLRLQSTETFVKKFQVQTPLEMEVAKILSGSENILTDDKTLTIAEERALKAMSLEEAKERLAELRKVRVLLSYKEARARRQNKIKSKGYHRIMKRDRLRKEMKEFEELKDTDPEMAIDRLKALDRQRIEERMTLKHKNTGKWAKQRMLRSKYDEKSREALIEQLELSRQLRQKIQVPSDSDDENPAETVMEIEDRSDENKDVPTAVDLSLTSYNPWMRNSTGNINSEKTPTMREQTTEQNESAAQREKKNDRTPARDTVTDPAENHTAKEASQTEHSTCESNTVITLESESENEDLDCSIIASVIVQPAKPDVQKENGCLEEGPNDCKIVAKKLLDQFKRNARTKKGGNLRKSSSILKTSSKGSSDEDHEIEELFAGGPTKSNDKQIRNLSDSEEEPYLLETHESEGGQPESAIGNVLRDGKSESEINVKDGKKTKPRKEPDAQIDPTKFITVKTKKLKSKLPDLVEAGDEGIDEEEDDSYQMTIAEAFADDDVLAEFKAEKKRAVDADRLQDVDLFLPGWGSWGGQDIKVSKRKRRRFVMKAPAAPPRQDKPLGNVIINERKDEKTAQHQVSELPFPFRSIRDFESSIRQPLGNTWNPETAFRQLIVPKVTTRMGAIIDPMDGDSLKTKPSSKQQKRKTKKWKVDSGSGKWNVTVKI